MNESRLLELIEYRMGKTHNNVALAREILAEVSRPESGSVGSVGPVPSGAPSNVPWASKPKYVESHVQAYIDYIEDVARVMTERYNALLSTANRGEVEPWREIDRLCTELKYIAGIVERGRGVTLAPDVSVSRAILGYVKELEAEVKRLQKHIDEHYTGPATDYIRELEAQVAELQATTQQPKDDAHRGEVCEWREAGTLIRAKCDAKHRGHSQVPEVCPYCGKRAVFTVDKPTPVQPRGEVSREAEPVGWIWRYMGDLHFSETRPAWANDPLPKGAEEVEVIPVYHHPTPLQPKGEVSREAFSASEMQHFGAQCQRLIDWSIKENYDHFMSLRPVQPKGVVDKKTAELVYVAIWYLRQIAEYEPGHLSKPEDAVWLRDKAREALTKLEAQE